MWRPVLNTFSFAVDDVEEMEDTRLTQEEEHTGGAWFLCPNAKLGPQQNCIYLYLTKSALCWSNCRPVYHRPAHHHH